MLLFATRQHFCLLCILFCRRSYFNPGNLVFGRQIASCPTGAKNQSYEDQSMKEGATYVGPLTRSTDFTMCVEKSEGVGALAHFLLSRYNELC